MDPLPGFHPNSSSAQATIAKFDRLEAKEQENYFIKDDGSLSRITLFHKFLQGCHTFLFNNASYYHIDTASVKARLTQLRTIIASEQTPTQQKADDAFAAVYSASQAPATVAPPAKAKMLVELVKFRDEYNRIENLADYEQAYKEHLTSDIKRSHLDLKSGWGNVHDGYFQNLALRLTAGKTPEQLKISNLPPAERHLIRARNFAVASREDLDWDGRSIAHQPEQCQQKQREMEAHWKSLTLHSKPAELDKQQGSHAGHIVVTQQDTQSAVEELAQRHSSNELCFINMANAFKTGGGYQQGDTAQEEVVCTSSDAIVVLSNAAHIEDSDKRTTYDQPIPKGGNYFHKTKFVTGDMCECNSIAHPFADFRDRKQSERAKFLKAGTQELDSTSEKYVERIKLDMRGVLRTARVEGKTVLVLSATGCGAFAHDPKAEAKAWKEVLNEPEFKGHFKEVRFAIFDLTNEQNNYKAFKAAFEVVT